MQNIVIAGLHIMGTSLGDNLNARAGGVSYVNLKKKTASYFTSKNRFIQSSRELQRSTSKLWQTLGHFQRTKVRNALL